jgi:hypothetical protein
VKKRSYAHLFTAAAVLVGSLLGVPKPVSAEDGRVAHIAHTDTGIYFRTDPNNWESRGALAGVDGDEVTLRCVIEGMAVGQFENHIWYKADNAKGSGLLPDHFLDTPIKANEYLAGMPRCDEDDPDKGPVTTSVFYSPLSSPTGLREFEGSGKPANLNLKYDDWGDETCLPYKATRNVPESVTTLSGWSAGRMGPVFFLAAGRGSQIHRIVLFDPGATSDMEDDSAIKKAYKSLRGEKPDRPCDDNKGIDINGALSSWLASNSQNQLVIFTGKDTEMKSNDEDPSSKPNFTALWKHYLAGIWNKPFAPQATICDYNFLSHEDAFRKFADQVQGWNGSCPSRDGIPAPTTWHP